MIFPDDVKRPIRGTAIDDDIFDMCIVLTGDAPDGSLDQGLTVEADGDDGEYARSRQGIHGSV